MHTEDKEKRFLRLQGGTVKNQVVFRMECAYGDSRLRGSRKGSVLSELRMLRRYVKELGGQMKVLRDGERFQTEIITPGR